MTGRIQVFQKTRIDSALERWGPMSVFCIALALRLAYLLDVWHSPVFDVFLLDADYYDRLAHKILAGDWLAGREIFTMSPLYPYFLALLNVFTGGSIAGVKLIQHVIGAVTSALLCRIGIRLGGPAAGCATGFLAATYGMFIFAEGTLENEFLAIFLNTLALWFLVEMDRPQSGRRIALAGLCIGLSIGVRPNAALLAIPAILWIFQNSRARLSHIAIFAAAAILPVLPIAIRNYAVSGEWVWTTSTGGQLVYIGTLPEGGGGYVVPPFVEAHPDTEHADFRRQAEKDLGRPIAVSEVSGYWIRQAWVRIRSNPAGYFELLGKKLLAFFNVDEPPDNYDYNLGCRYSRVLSLPLTGIGLILSFSVLGFLFAARPLRLWVLPLGFFVVYLLSVLVFYQSYRFRLPAVPSLLLLAGAAVAWIGRIIKERSIQKIFLAAVILIPVLIVSRLSLPQTTPVSDMANVAGEYAQLLRRRGRLPQAAAILRDALRIDPHNPQNVRQLADLLLDLRYYRESAELYHRIADHPQVGHGVYFNLALCYAAMGEPTSAQTAAEKAVRQDPDNADALRLMGILSKMASGKKRVLDGQFNIK